MKHKATITLEFDIMSGEERKAVAQEISDMLLGKYSIHGVSKKIEEFVIGGQLEGYCVQVYGTAESLPPEVPNPYKGLFIVYKKEPQASI